MGCCAEAKVVFIQVLKKTPCLLCSVVFSDSGGKKLKKKVQYCYSPDILLTK